ncbi:hypothetical protein ACQY0O_003818 [Thecaphora frezii]
MSITPSASPTVHVGHWSETQVADWLGSIGLSKFAKEFKSNGITGDVLVLLDDDALRDIGVATVGQRLALLSAIYRLKLQFGIPIQEGDWIPKSSEAQDSYASAAASPHLVSLLRQRDDRIRLLEGQIFKLADYLSRFQQDFASVCKHVGVKTLTSEMTISVTPASSRSAEAGGHSHTSSDSSAHSLSTFGSQTDLASSVSSHAVDSPTIRHFPGLVSPSRSAFTPGLAATLGHRSGAASGPATSSYGLQQGEDAPSSSLSTGHAAGPSAGPSVSLKTVNSAPTNARSDAHTSSNAAAGPNTPTAASGISGSTSLPSLTAAGAELSPTQSTPSVTPTTMTPGNGHTVPASAVQSPTRRTAQPSPSNGTARTAAMNQNSLPQPHSTSPNQASSSAAAGTSNEGPLKSEVTTSTTSTALPSKGSTSASNSGGGSGSTDSNPYKSFRVTLDDPCHKVLPAALKKYKIVDDWRLYALFICYGNTERCLSYDEKPLLLFQKLKENKQSPVFMLRHIRDVKSPIAIANAKAEAKKGQSAGMQSAKSLSPSATGRSDKRRVIDGPPPPGASITYQHAPVETGPAAELPAANKANRTYAVAIYPYMSERSDEFDVAVGDVFMVLNKAKGWWVVQRDGKGDGTGDIVYSVPTSELDESATGVTYQAEIASGWVPAGCLLETSRPLAQITEPGTLSAGRYGRDRSGSVTNSSPNTPTVASAAAAVIAPSATSGASGSGMADANGVSTARASIPPSYITSTSTLGIMLMDYHSAEDGLELRKDDRLRVFKRYNHWSYCVQEGEGHARGWVPSWYIGKVSSTTPTGPGGASSIAPRDAKAGTAGGAATTTPANNGANGSSSGPSGNANGNGNGNGTTISPTTLLGSSAAGAGAVTPTGEARSPGQVAANGDGRSPGKNLGGEGSGPGIAGIKGEAAGDEV